jgi:predicted aspartyl protease
MGTGVTIRVHDKPYVPAFINGRGPVWFLLDTGCLGCFLSRRAADGLALEVDANGATFLAEIRIGSGLWRNVRFGVQDDPALFGLPGPPFDGFLGNGFIEFFRDECKVTIDYPAETGEFRRPGEKPSVGQVRHGTAGIPLSLENHYTIVPAGLNGHGPFRFVLDTGAACCNIGLV